MAKESEVPGQEPRCVRCGQPESTHPDLCPAMPNERLLSCGCWVALEHTGACALHGEETFVYTEKVPPPSAEQLPTWLDEVAKDMMAAMVEPDLVNCTDQDALRFVERARSIAYNLAQALLAEGKKRREAK